ncbi:cupin domain-containing protein [Actinocorallia sp. API 0066]|uniref:cupin domain-containing protein n=1 Tax=Actinocorallia sp. API 0066 TaxID=2896846 RepID=UPI001E5E11B5|nr:cupin domain-containing protein [Actinocorallia sp. API 0066]MCD0451619.1 cupin domain-containing protein [Actinocorallia sp. API 0066]
MTPERPRPTTAEVLDLAYRRLEGLPRAERDDALQRFLLLAFGVPPTRARDQAEGGRVNTAVALARWADDDGLADGLAQRLAVLMSPRGTDVGSVEGVTGQPLLSNGFLGADLIHVPAGRGFAPHVHRGDHLLFVVGGRGTITAAGEILETAPGQAYLVAGLQPHAVGAISDHVLLSVGVSHRALDSADRQTLVPFSDLLAADGLIRCRVCGLSAPGEHALRRLGCGHAPVGGGAP